ncbi:MAG: GMC family oxidoreductase [Blastocatellia bacterium]
MPKPIAQVAKISRRTITPTTKSTVAGSRRTENREMYAPGHSIHEVGTARMGSDPKTSVLNQWNQAHEIENLLVVDGSCFVSSGCVNPTLTILALAMRANMRSNNSNGELFSEEW